VNRPGGRRAPLQRGDRGQNPGTGGARAGHHDHGGLGGLRTTAIVPSAMPVNWSMPVRNSPAMAIITVRPETTIERPDVPAAIRSASGNDRPRARSSRSRRR